MKPGATSDPLVDLSQIAEIELFILKRMKELALGDHASVFKGPGFNFVGLRDWEPGDRVSSIDWAQSTVTNFSPMVVREFEQSSNAAIVAVADASLSTRCGAHGTPIAAAIARAIAAAGLSAVFFQDLFGLVTFDEEFREVEAVRPRVGRPHVVHCIERYQDRAPVAAPAAPGELGTTIAAHLRRTSLVPVISDFLFADPARIVRELSLLNALHDVFLIMVDVRFAYQVPDVRAGWIEIFDVEAGTTRIVSARELRQVAARIEEWQEHIQRLARDAALDIVRIGLDRWEMEAALVSLVAERRLRKV
ncbi:MAG TPA: DUF58 domain-containing protein [Vicinamibacterales bacterium]|jgi:uncharacterized protein (DUF58 family)|nr:DUF58 domain-containing protein [Vicinamibacterales bacterium]